MIRTCTQAEVQQAVAQGMAGGASVFAQAMFGGRDGAVLRDCEIVGVYRGHPQLRVRLADSGSHAHVHPLSIVKVEVRPAS